MRLRNLYSPVSSIIQSSTPYHTPKMQPTNNEYTTTYNEVMSELRTDVVYRLTNAYSLVKSEGDFLAQLYYNSNKDYTNASDSARVAIFQLRDSKSCDVMCDSISKIAL